jgi:hypothetical protein
MQQASTLFPCSICDEICNSPKDLGTHILNAHCHNTTTASETTTTTNNNKTKEENAVIEAISDKAIVMDVDPLDHMASMSNGSRSGFAALVKSENNITTHNSGAAGTFPDQTLLDDTILPVLPRQPSIEEQKQKFLMYNLPSDPANFMRYVYFLFTFLAFRYMYKKLSWFIINDRGFSRKVYKT